MLKIGIVGTSKISEQFLSTVQMHSQIIPQCIVSRTTEQASTFQKKYDIPYHFPSIEEAVQSEVDAFYIASPNALHYEQAKIALKAQKHVLLEKPFTSTVRELDELVSLATQNNVVLMEAIRLIYFPNFLLFKDTLKNFPNITHVDIHFCRRSDRYDLVLKGEEPNIFSPKMSGGSLMDIGVYGLWAAVALFGSPRSWTHQADIIPTKVDGSGMVTLEYDQFSVKVYHSKKEFSGTHIAINSPSGSLIVPSFPVMKGFLNEKNEFISVPQKDQDMYYELDAFYQAITHLSSHNSHLKESRIVLEIMEECRHQVGVFYPADNVNK